MAWLFVCMGTGDVLANNYYADPVNGHDNNAGSLSAPVKTLRAGIGKLSAGDTLYLREGNYYENGVDIDVSGTASLRITIKNYLGEYPVIDGGYQDFRTTSNSDWELHDSSRNIYRSTGTFTGAGTVHAYLKTGATTTSLIAYDSYDNLASDNQSFTETGSIYVGPGLFWNSVDRRIYIRLTPSDLETQMGYLIPSNGDPRQNSIYIVPSGVVVDFTGNASYLDIEGVDFRYRNNAVHFSSGHHINIKNVNVLGGTSFILAEKAAHDLVFDGLTANGYFPPWLAFKDIKSATRPAHAMEVAAVVLRGSEHVEIKNSTIQHMLDFLDNGGDHLYVHHNNFFELRDDVVQIGTQYSHVEMAYNKVINCSKSFDRYGGSTVAYNAPYLGTKYVHHNIIDLRKRHLHFRPGDPMFERTGGDGKIHNRAFGTHSVVDKDPWKIYHNTVMIGKAVNANFFQDGIAFDYDETLAPGVPHEVYNNIFIQTEDHMMARGSRVHDGSAILDGNVYFRSATGAVNAFFYNWNDGVRDASFYSLAAFKSSSYFQQTKSNYSPGWENSGVEADPMLDRDYHPAASGPAATGAIDLSAKGWPGLDNAAYRGALAPLSGISPVITSALSAVGTIGAAFSYQISATNSPTSFNAAGLPAGLSVSTGGLLSGTPTTAGTSSVAISASNASGTGSASLSLSVYSACDLNRDDSTNVVDVQLQVNQALGVAGCASDLNRDGLCNVIDVQRDVNAGLGGACVLGP